MMSYKKRGGLRFLTIGRLSITWSVRKRLRRGGYVADLKAAS